MNINVVVDQLIDRCTALSFQPPLGRGHSSEHADCTSPKSWPTRDVSTALPTLPTQHQATNSDAAEGPVRGKSANKGTSRASERLDDVSCQMGKGQKLEQQPEHMHRSRDDWTSNFCKQGHENEVNEGKTIVTDVNEAENSTPPNPKVGKPEPATAGSAPVKPTTEMALKSVSLLDGYENETGEFAQGNCGGAEAVPMLDIFREKSDSRGAPQRVGLRRVASTRKLGFLMSLEPKHRKLEVLAREYKYREGCALVRGRQGKKLPACWILGAIRSLLRSEREMRAKDVAYLCGKPPLPTKRTSPLEGKQTKPSIVAFAASKDSLNALSPDPPGGASERKGVGKGCAEPMTTQGDGHQMKLKSKLTDSSRREMLTALRQRLSNQQLRKSIDGVVDQRKQAQGLGHSGFQDLAPSSSTTTRARRSMEQERKWFSHKFSPVAFASASPSYRAFTQPSKHSPNSQSSIHNAHLQLHSLIPARMNTPSSSKGAVCMSIDAGLAGGTCGGSGATARKPFGEGEGCMVGSVSKAQLLRKTANGKPTDEEVFGGRHSREFLKLLRTQSG